MPAPTLLLLSSLAGACLAAAAETKGCAARGAAAGGSLGVVLLQRQHRRSLAPSGSVASGSVVFLRSPRSGNRVTAEPNGYVHAYWDHTGEWQKFTVEKPEGGGSIMSGDKVILTAWNGHTVTVQGETVHANWDHRGSWEQLVIESTGGGSSIADGDTVQLRGHTGACVSIDSFAPGDVKAVAALCQGLVIDLAEAPGPSTTAELPATPTRTSPDGFPLDGFGVKQLFPSGGEHRDWTAEWQEARVGYGGVNPDAGAGASFRGGSSNRFRIGGGELIMDNPSDQTNTPRYYIHQQNENVEFTAYFWVAEEDYHGGSSATKGPTLVVRSNHDLYAEAPCEARGYYMRLVPTERKFRFLKEYYHGGGGTKYGPPGGNWGASKSTELAAFPWSQWVGLKFVVRSKPGGDVHLQAFMDLTGGADGGDWQLRHELTDSASDDENTYGCPHASVFGQGRVAFLRADSMNPIRWTKASLREVEAFGSSAPAPWS